MFDKLTRRIETGPKDERIDSYHYYPVFVVSSQLLDFGGVPLTAGSPDGPEPEKHRPVAGNQRRKRDFLPRDDICGFDTVGDVGTDLLARGAVLLNRLLLTVQHRPVQEGRHLSSRDERCGQ